MIPLNEHCSELSDVISETDDCVLWGSVYEWLRIASSIESVTLNTIKNNRSFGWYRDSDEYDLARDELLNSFVQKLTVFNFVWGALESATDIIKPPKHPEKDKRGKISNTCYLIGKRFNADSQISELEEETTTFKEISSKCFGFERVKNRISRIQIMESQELAYTLSTN